MRMHRIYTKANRVRAEELGEKGELGWLGGNDLNTMSGPCTV